MNPRNMGLETLLSRRVLFVCRPRCAWPPKRNATGYDRVELVIQRGQLTSWPSQLQPRLRGRGDGLRPVSDSARRDEGSVLDHVPQLYTITWTWTHMAED